MKRAVIRYSTVSALPVLTALCMLAAGPAAAQTGTERTQGLRDNTPRWHAITQARLVMAPGRVVESGTLVMKDGVIVAAGGSVAVPVGARVWALPGRTVYAGFIDLASPLGVPAALKPAAPMRPGFGPLAALPPPVGPRPMAAMPVARGLAARNAVVRAEQEVAQQLDWKIDEVRAARELGFTVVLATPANGVFRGQSALLALGAPDSGDAKSQVIAPRVAQHLAFEIGIGRETYPTSLMGAVALIRQTLLDARWKGRTTLTPATGSAGERIEPNASLEALLPVLGGRQPVIHVAEDEQDYLRIGRLRDEFKLRAVVQGNGYEYRRAAQLKALALPVIVPLAYPARPEVDNPDAALDVSLASLQHWEQAPSNLALIDRAGVSFAVTPAGLRDPKREFWPRLRQAVRRGLPAERALAGLTTVPAELVGEAARLGTLEPGRIANIVVARGDLFTSDEADIELTFVDGRPLPTEAAERADLRGSWAVDGSAEVLQISGTRAAPRLQRDAGVCELAQRGNDWVLRLPCGRANEAGAASAPAALPSVVSARLRGDRWTGTVQVGEGPLQAWSAQRTAAAAAAPAASAALALAAADAAVKPPAPTWPAGAAGIALPEQPAAVLLRNATVWTQGPAGTLPRADVLMRAGKVSAVGPDLAAPSGSLVIDATGKHLTPGLIDAHSHVAMARGNNEFSHSVTAEVRVADIIDATDMTIYRQLAGGTTAANVLHGSANTIGGQNQVIKLRWGGDAAALVFVGAQPGIKFALGENVKRSNFGPGSRYPGTRMGVEQVLRDAFAAAEEYAAEWKAFREAQRSAKPGLRREPRRDLQLETLVELMERKRAIHVHSYRADEILMFARFAREKKLEVAAFQHVLEGYKVADEIAAIGAGGSTFSDWWAFKMEVADAIPHNAALMARAGVLTTLNSDDAELGRRLNTEAAKAVKYGGLMPEEALAMVTLNAAKQLGVAARTGSLEPGKDADLVVWNGPPMATTSRVEQTWVDGRRYFDIATDRSLRERDAAERSRLVAAVLRTPRPASGAAGAGGGAPPGAAASTRPTFTEGLAWFRLFDQARAFRNSYADQAAWHECTEDAP